MHQWTGKQRVSILDTCNSQLANIHERCRDESEGRCVHFVSIEIVRETTDMPSLNFGKNPTRGAYRALVERFPLCPIRTQAELDAAVRVVDELLDRHSELKFGEREYLEVLGDLVRAYEQSSAPRANDLADGEMVAFLIESKGVTQAQVAAAVKISESTISAVIAGNRNLTRTHIARLSKYFGVGPATFSFAF